MTSAKPRPENTAPFPENPSHAGLRRWLEAEGFAIAEQHSKAAEGPDIVAVHPAKGTWRLKVGEGRGHGPAVAFFAAAAMARGRESGERVGLALPRSPEAERALAKVRPAMILLGIGVLWIEPTGSVALEEPERTEAGLRPEELNASNDG